MIDKIEIRNFRTQVKQNIELSPGVTTIVGSSFAGKSTAVKTLKWVATNKPAGDSIINWDADKAVARITVDGSKKVVRKRGKGINLYKLNKKKFTAFGSDVPPDIANLFNMADINFQGQFDAPFWFCETAGEVSRQLNAIINLEIIDNTLFNIAAQLRKTKIVIGITQDKLKLAIERKKNLGYIKNLNNDFKRVENLCKEFRKKTAESSVLQGLLKSGLCYAQTHKNASEANLRGRKALSEGDILQKISLRAERLSELIQNGRKYRRIINNKPPPLQPITDLKLKWDKLTHQLDMLNELIELVKRNKEEKCLAEKELLLCRKRFKEIVGKECPLCGNLIKTK